MTQVKRITAIAKWNLKLESSLWDYNDAYILSKGTISVAALVAGGGNNDKELAFKKCALFIVCVCKINNTQVDNAKDFDVGMPMYNLIEFRDNYSKTFKVYCNAIEMNHF